MEPQSPKDEDAWRLSVVEGRREQVEAFTWSVPGLAIAGQAFLLSIVLSRDVTHQARIVAALAGLIAAVAAAHLYAKQVYLFDLYEGFLERERRRLGLPGVQTDDLKRGGFPENTLHFQRGWETKRWRRWLIVDRRAANVWFGALVLFALIDVVLLGYSGYALICSDPDWL
jgi:hypothetical protein